MPTKTRKAPEDASAPTSNGTEPPVEDAVPDDVPASADPPPEEPPDADKLYEPSGQGVLTDTGREITNKVTGPLPRFCTNTLKGAKWNDRRQIQPLERVYFIVEAVCVGAGNKHKLDHDDEEGKVQVKESWRAQEFEMRSVQVMDDEIQASLQAGLFIRTEAGELGEDEAADLAAQTESLIEDPAVAARAAEIAEQDERVRAERAAAAGEDWPEAAMAPERRVMCSSCEALVSMEPVDADAGETDEDRFISGEEHGCGQV